MIVPNKDDINSKRHNNKKRTNTAFKDTNGEIMKRNDTSTLHIKFLEKTLYHKFHYNDSHKEQYMLFYPIMLLIQSIIYYLYKIITIITLNLSIL